MTQEAIKRPMNAGDKPSQASWMRAPGNAGIPKMQQNREVLQIPAQSRKIELLVRQLRSVPAVNTDAAELLHAEADYFERNRERTRYPSFRSHNLFVGSGIIEAACRTVIAKRLKQSGMFWTVRGADAIIALRCTRLSGRFEYYGASRSKAA